MGHKKGMAYASSRLSLPVDDHLRQRQGRLKAEGSEAKYGDVELNVVQDEVAEPDEAGVEAEELDVPARRGRAEVSGEVTGEWQILHGRERLTLRRSATPIYKHKFD